MVQSTKCSHVITFKADELFFSLMLQVKLKYFTSRMKMTLSPKTLICDLHSLLSSLRAGKLIRITFTLITKQLCSHNPLRVFLLGFLLLACCFFSFFLSQKSKSLTASEAKCCSGSVIIISRGGQYV